MPSKVGAIIICVSRWQDAHLKPSKVDRPVLKLEPSDNLTLSAAPKKTK